MAEVRQGLNSSGQASCQWREEYGGMGTDQAHRLKELERENASPKKLVADMSLDNAILRETARGNF